MLLKLGKSQVTPPKLPLYIPSPKGWCHGYGDSWCVLACNTPGSATWTVTELGQVQKMGFLSKRRKISVQRPCSTVNFLRRSTWSTLCHLQISVYVCFTCWSMGPQPPPATIVVLCHRLLASVRAREVQQAWVEGSSLFSSTFLQHFSTTCSYNTLLQHFFTTRFSIASLQFYNTLLPTTIRTQHQHKQHEVHFPKKNKYEQSLQSQNTYEQSQQQNPQTELNTPELPIVTLRYAGRFSGTW